MEEQTLGEKIITFVQNFLGNFSRIKNNRVASLLGLLLVVMFIILATVIFLVL